MNNNTLIEALFEIGSTIRIIFADKKEIKGRVAAIAEDSLSVKIGKEQTFTLKKEDVGNIISCQIVDYPSYFFSPIESPLPDMLPARGRIIFLRQGKRNEYGRSQPFGMIADNQSQTAIFFYRTSILDDVLRGMDENEVKGQLVTYFIKKGIENHPQAVAIIRPMTVDSALSLAKQVSKYEGSILEAHALLQIIKKQNSKNSKLNILLNKIERKSYVKNNKWKELSILAESSHNNDYNDTSNESPVNKKQKEYVQATGEVTHYNGEYGYILSDNKSFYFSRKDILDDELLPQLQDFLKPSRFYPRIPVVCSFDNIGKRASSICRPLELAVFTSELVNMLKRRRMKEVKELLDIIKVQFPANPKILRIEQQYDEIISFQSTNKSYDFTSLKPCGFIVGTPVTPARSPQKKAKKESVHFARIGDCFLDILKTKTKYHIDDILDEQYKSQIKENDPVLYQLIEEESTKGQRIFRALFIVPLRPIGDLLLLAENKFERRCYLEAWGIAKNIIDQIPNNYEAKKLMESCEKECIEIPKCINIHRHLFRARNYLSDRNYEQSIKYYQRSQIVDLNQDVFVRPMIDCYRNLLSQTIDVHKRIRIRAQYVSFCEKYLNLLDLSKPDNLQCQIDYYNEIDNYEAVIDVYKKKLSQLATENDYESIAITYASIAEEYLLSSLPNNLDNAIVNINCALRVDYNCKKALRYREVIALSALIRNKALGEQQYKSFDVNDLLQTKNQDILPAKEESSFKTIEYERFAIVLEISKTKDPFSICGLIYRFLSTFQYSTANEYLSQISLLPSKPLHKVLFFVEKLCDIIDNGQEVLAKIRPLSLISSSATALLAKVLWEYDWRTACGLVTTTQLSSETSFVRYGLELSKQRELWWKQIEQLSIIRDSLLSDFSIQKFIDFVEDLDSDLLNDTFVAEEITQQLLPTCQNYYTSTNLSNIIDTEKQLIELSSVIITLVERRPTLLSFSILKPLLIRLNDFVNNTKAQRVLKMPEPTVNIVSYSAIDELGNVLVEVEISNKDNAACRMDSVELEIVSSQYLWGKDSSGYERNSVIKGGDSTILLYTIQISDEHWGKTSVPLCFKLKYLAKGELIESRHNYDLPITKSYYNFIEDNPYAAISGEKVEDKDMFFGRDDIIDQIVARICPTNTPIQETFPVKQTILYGQKRCGKSSVLIHLEKSLEVEDKVLCISVDFNNIYTEAKCYKTILNAINQKIRKQQNKCKKIGILDCPSIILPEDFKKADCVITFEIFRDTIAEFKRSMQECESVYWKQKRLVVLIDEFSVLLNEICDPSKELSYDFVKNWNVLQSDNRTNFSTLLVCKDVIDSFIISREHLNDYKSTKKIRLSYLDKKDARMLIEKPIFKRTSRQDFFLEGAVDRILYYTACSAHYTVLFCEKLLLYSTRNKLSHITKADIDLIAQELVDSDDMKFDRFDALLQAGESDFISKYSREEVETVLKQIAKEEILHPEGCLVEHLNIINPRTSKQDPKYLEDMLTDMENRDVIIKKNEFLFVKIKLYLVWIMKEKIL